MPDLRDVLRGLRSRAGVGGPRHGGGDRLSWWKRTKGQHRFRFFRFFEQGQQVFFGVRPVHFTGGTPMWLDCTGPGCTVCQSRIEMEKIARLQKDAAREAAWEKVRETRVQSKFEFLVVDTKDPVKFQILELSESSSRKLFLLAAKEVGYLGAYPTRVDEDATDAQKQEAEAQAAEFDVKMAEGLATLCGPTGRDVVLTYNPEAADKSDFYIFDIARGPQKVIDLKEDESAPSPTETRKRVQEAKNRK